MIKINKEQWQFVCKAMGTNGVSIGDGLVVATDGSRIHGFRVEGGVGAFVLRSFEAKQLQDENFTILGRDDPYIHLQTESHGFFHYISKQGKYPPVRHFTDITDYPYSMTVDADQFIRLLGSTLPKGDGDTGVKLSVYPNKKYDLHNIRPGAHFIKEGKAHSVNMDGPMYDIYFDARHMLDAAIPGTEMRLSFGDPESVFRVDYNERPFAVISPRRV